PSHEQNPRWLTSERDLRWLASERNPSISARRSFKSIASLKLQRLPPCKSHGSWSSKANPYHHALGRKRPDSVEKKIEVYLKMSVLESIVLDQELEIEMELELDIDLELDLDIELELELHPKLKLKLEVHRQAHQPSACHLYDHLLNQPVLLDIHVHIHALAW
ncbi:hypothetical protein HAX54_025315, partial [Datura stramonium]|nr:hypothetical protein [Datura stramonium]